MMSKISNKNDKEDKSSLFNFVSYTLVTCISLFGMIFGLRAATYSSLRVQNFQKEGFRWGILAGMALFWFSLMVWTYAEKDKQVDSFGDMYGGSDDNG